MTSSKVRKPFPLHHVNSWRMHRQFLYHPYPSKTILELIRAIGWIYSPGCSTPYLSLWSRSSSFKAGDLDKLVFEDRKLIQLETLRGCTMLVPRDQASVALRIRTRTFTELSKQARQQMPISDADMEKLKTALLNALHSGHKTAEQLARLIQQMGLLLFVGVVALYFLWRFVKSRLERRLRVERLERLKKR